MAFTVKQMTDEPIILITYRRQDSTIDEATNEGTKIAYLLREIGDTAYVILDLSGHKNTFQSLYYNIHDILQTNRGNITNPSQSIVIVGSTALVNYHQSETKTRKSELFSWIVTNDLEQAFDLVRIRIEMNNQPSQSDQEAQ